MWPRLLVVKMKKIIFLGSSVLFFFLVQFLFFSVRKNGWDFALTYQYQIYVVLTCIPLIWLILSIPYTSLDVSFLPWVFKIVLLLIFVCVTWRIGFRGNELKIMSLAILCFPASFLMLDCGGVFSVFDFIYVFIVRCIILALFLIYYFRIYFSHLGS